MKKTFWRPLTRRLKWYPSPVAADEMYATFMRDIKKRLKKESTKT